MVYLERLIRLCCQRASSLFTAASASFQNINRKLRQIKKDIIKKDAKLSLTKQTTENRMENATTFGLNSHALGP